MKHLSYLFAFMLLSVWGMAQLPDLKLEDFAEGLNEPLGIENCGDSRLFIIEKGGTIRILNQDGNILPEPFLDISNGVNSEGGEQGLLGLAFHPNYSSNGLFFVYFTDMDDNINVSRFTADTNDPNKADKESQVTLFKITHPFENHNGGCMKFGPDGYLYIAVGDGGAAGDPFMVAQNPEVMLGKMLRIDVTPTANSDYSIPVSNPYANTVGPQAKEVWSLGLRNPWRFSFDSQTGDLWIGDVGQNLWEEVNMESASSLGGVNYGWPCYEANKEYHSENFNCPPVGDLTFPVARYPHKFGDCTVIGGFVYRGSTFANMFGKYIYADFCSGKIWAFYQGNNGEWKNVLLTQEEPFELVGFGEDMNHELYAADIAEGEIYKVVDSSVMRIAGAGAGQSEVSLYPNPNQGSFILSWIAGADENCKLIVSDLMGREVLSQERQIRKGFNEWQLSMDHLASGDYILHLHSSSGIISKKVIVE